MDSTSLSACLPFPAPPFCPTVESKPNKKQVHPCILERLFQPPDQLLRPMRYRVTPPDGLPRTALVHGFRLFALPRRGGLRRSGPLVSVLGLRKGQ
jgi:hypothetical protein